MWAKIQTIIIVVILSCLIWVFAEREVTKPTTVSVKIELTAPENILLRFLDNDDNPLPEDYQMVDLTVEGPVGKIQKVRQEYLNNITRDVASMGIELTDDRPQQVSVTNILDDRLPSIDRQSWLRIVDAKPKSLRLLLTKLQRQPVPITVYYNGDILIQAKVTPAEVEPFVLNGKPTEARVTLTQTQYQQALHETVAVTAKAVLPGRGAEDFPIELTISADGQSRPGISIKNPRLGVVMPYIMEGKYKVIIDNIISQLDDYNPIDCRGTPEALNAYQKSDVHLILKINESDMTGDSSTSSRPLSYYTPTGCDDIEIIDKKQTPISFRLEKISD